MPGQPHRHLGRWFLTIGAVVVTGLVVAVIVAIVRGGKAEPIAGSPPGTELFAGLSVQEGSQLIAVPIVTFANENKIHAETAYLQVLGDPAEVWAAYRDHVATTFDIDVPAGLNACRTDFIEVFSNDVCVMEGDIFVKGGRGPAALTVRMAQPDNDFSGHYYLAIELRDRAEKTATQSLKPGYSSKKGKVYDEIPAPKPPAVDPPQSGELVGSGYLNDSYDETLIPEGAQVLANLQTGLGIGGVSVLMAYTGDDADAAAFGLADSVAGIEPAETITVDGIDYTAYRGLGIAGDNGCTAVIARTPDGDVYIYFTVWID